MASTADQHQFPYQLSGGGNIVPRQKNGTVKVDPHSVHEELCTTVMAHRTILSNTELTGETRRTYLADTLKQDEEIIKKTGRDLALMMSKGERNAAKYLEKQKHQQALQTLKTNLRDMLAKVEILEKAAVNEDDQGEIDGDEVGVVGIPGLSRTTRNGRGTKRKQDVEELLQQATGIHKVAKTMKDKGRLRETVGLRPVRAHFVRNALESTAFGYSTLRKIVVLATDISV